jgi:DNA polymerase-3 subunit delta'
MADVFGAIIGQEPAIARLRAGLAADRLPHGLLFAGPVGVGKFTTAAALAKAFLGGGEDVARRVDRQTHPDFHVITRQLIRYHDETGKSKGIDLSVKVIRPELIEPANRHAVEGVGKVFVVEEAETMNAAAQNALLKTLEEPAGRTLIVLLTDQPESLLPTIRSRCQAFPFAELSEADAVRVLEMKGIGAREARAAVAIAGGSPGRALRFIEDGVVERAGELFDRIENGGELKAWLKDAAEHHAGRQLARDPLGSKDAFTRQGYTLYLSLAAEHFRRRLAEEEDAGGLEALCERIDAVARAEEYLSSNVNVSLAIQQLELALGAET